jgi:hypothetical protein
VRMSKGRTERKNKTTDIGEKDGKKGKEEGRGTGPHWSMTFFCKELIFSVLNVNEFSSFTSTNIQMEFKGTVHRDGSTGSGVLRQVFVKG